MEDHDEQVPTLDGLAKSLARESLKKIFFEPSRLTRRVLAQTRAEYETELRAVDSQLNAGLEAQLDEMQRCMDQLAAIKGKMARIQGNFEAIDGKCHVCRATIGGWESVAS